MVNPNCIVPPVTIAVVASRSRSKGAEVLTWFAMINVPLLMTKLLPLFNTSKAARAALAFFAPIVTVPPDWV